MTATNNNVAPNPVLTSALQAALQGKTDLFSMIDGGNGFAAFLQQLDINQSAVTQSQANARADNTSAGGNQPAADAYDASSSGQDDTAPRLVPKASANAKADARNKENADADDQDDARIVTDDQERDDAVPEATADAGSDMPDIVAPVAAVAAPVVEESGQGSVVQGNRAGVDVVASIEAQQLIGPQLLPRQAQQAEKENEEGVHAVLDTVVQDTPHDIVSSGAGATPDNMAGMHKGQTQAATADDAVGTPTDLQANDFAPFHAAPAVETDTVREPESATGSAGAPLARDDKSPGGASPSLTAFMAAFKPAETPVNNTPNGANASGGVAKHDASGLRLYEAVGKLAQGYEQTAQLTAPKSAKSTALSAAQVIEQVTVRLNQQAKSGLDQMTIQLRPADLGRVDIKLNFHDGAVTALVTADSQTTLDILAKDSRSLERALQDAGLRADSGSLSFQLRDPGGRGAAPEERQAGTSGDFDLESPDVIAAEAVDEDDVYIIEPYRVNLRV